MKNLGELLRPNIIRLLSNCDDDRFRERGKGVLLDANENPYNVPQNRYPDALSAELKASVSKIWNVDSRKIFVGNGTDEMIDLLYKCFVRPETDNVVSIYPTYQRYFDYAVINDAEYRKVTLDSDFQVSAEQILAECDSNTKIVWLCSPNNPTGNCLRRDEIRKLLSSFGGIVVVDEAYVRFSNEKSMIEDLAACSNLVVLDTLSTAWGCASARIGLAFANAAIADVLNHVRSPYNISQQAQMAAIEVLGDVYEADKRLKTILLERDRLEDAFRLLPYCRKVYHSDANFLLVAFEDAQNVYTYLQQNAIFVCDQTSVQGCSGCLRITVGTKSENNKLLSALRQY